MRDRARGVIAGDFLGITACFLSGAACGWLWRPIVSLKRYRPTRASRARNRRRHFQTAEKSDHTGTAKAPAQSLEALLANLIKSFRHDPSPLASPSIGATLLGDYLHVRRIAKAQAGDSARAIGADHLDRRGVCGRDEGY